MRWWVGGWWRRIRLHLAEPGWEWDSVLKSSEVVGEEARFLLADRMEMSEQVH